jgi:hypothetical protein
MFLCPGAIILQANFEELALSVSVIRYGGKQRAIRRDHFQASIP